MRRLVVSALTFAAALAGAGVATAQPGLSGGNDINAIDRSLRIDENQRKEREAEHREGLAALQAGDFVLAEKRFAKLLAFNPTTSDASYLMGLAQLGLEKWPEARLSLEAAVKNEPKRPEPKARLGVAHVMLRDINSAADQHDALSALARECNGCPDQKNINDNLLMLDRILVAATKPKTAAPG